MGLARPFHRLLIANRGEIAVRIARAARSAGIAALGIASDADAHALHTESMDEVARIGPGEAARSYLDIDRVIDAARRLRADAVHPGYGFLSERAPFARACADAGLVFVGPPPEALEAMGDKAAAKQLARTQLVPVVPGYDGGDQSPERLFREAIAIGLPLLIKATAGGGGRGMRVLRTFDDFDEELASARREALASFGDDRVLLERYVEHPRHVEIQIVADSHGTVVAFGERECSIQRRHQKVIEEAPSPALRGGVRASMVDAAIRAARAVGYVNAGTVEFLLEASGAFYFLEMNARLQVEHPVTEIAHGIDLVQLQFAVARGERLDPALGSQPTRAWAIEARITAEDADGRPATGTISNWAPPEGDGIRLDSGVRTGSEVTIYYDSLLAKLICFGPDRPAALARLRDALGRFEVEGLPTNLPQLRAIARDAAFVAGNTTTAFLTERAESLAALGPESADDIFLLATGALATDERTWRIARAAMPIALASGARTVRGVLSPGDAADAWSIAGDLSASFALERTGDRVTIRRDTPEGPRVASGRVAIEISPGGTPSVVVRTAETYARLYLPSPPRRTSARDGAGGAGGAIVSPMPGKVVRVAVTAGAIVAERELVVVLEAMKMEHRIVAPDAGTVRAVHVAEGAIVPAGAPLVEIDASFIAEDRIRDLDARSNPPTPS